MRRFKKKWIKKLIILLVLFLASGAGILFWMNRNQEEDVLEKITWKDATLPVVSAQVEGNQVNILHGYVEDMNVVGMRDTITPLPDNRQLELLVDTYGVQINSIYYEIKSIDGERLIDKTDLSSWDTNENKLSLKLPIQNLLDENEEYQLIIHLVDSNKREIRYYTRIIESNQLKTKDMIDFVLNFHEKTLSDDSSLAAYLKPSTSDTTTFGTVNLNGNFSQLTWGTLAPKQIDETKVFLTDINDTIATFRLESTVRYTDDNGKKQTCKVIESFSVQNVYSQWYVLSYERNASQVFDGSKNQVVDGKINFGIQPTDSITTVSSSNGQYQAFVLNGELWRYNAKDGKDLGLVKVFSFKQDADDVRADYRAHDIKIVSVKDDGRVDFVIYGYMNCGNHEGEVGMGFYHYNATNKSLEEIFYLSYDKSFEMLEQQLGKLCYITDDNIFYLMFNQKIYAVDFQGNESVKIVDNVTEDNISISMDGSAVAWQEDNSKNGADTLQVLYMDTGEQNTITANKGELLRTLGFVENDFVYGIVKKTDAKKVSESESVPMYRLVIVNNKGEEQVHYQKKNIYIASISISQSESITMNRVRIMSNGHLKEIDSDILIQNENTDRLTAKQVDNGMETKCLTTWYLTVPSTTYKGEYQSVSQFYVKQNKKLSIDIQEEAEDTYYCNYAKGKLQGVYSSVSQAIEAGYADTGTVIDQNGEYVFRRGYREYVNLTMDVDDASNEEESLEVCLEAMIAFKGEGQNVHSEIKKGTTAEKILEKVLEGRAYDLTGCKLSQVIYYYLAGQNPILAKGANGYVLITGINGEEVTWYDPVSKNTTKKTLTEAEKYFSEYGMEYIGYLD